MLPEIRLTGSWETMLDGEPQRTLEENILPAYMPRQRWFGAKTRRVCAVRIVDQARLREDSALLLGRVKFADGTSDLYFLPLAVRNEAPPGLALARLVGPAGSFVLIDALADAELCQRLLAAIGQQQEVRTQAGYIRCLATPAFAALRGDPAHALDARLGPATSSNSLVFYGEHLLLKVFRRLEPGINPDYEIGRFLTERAGFTRTPKIAGALEYHRPGAEVVTLALLQEYIPGAVDGWQHALQALGALYDSVANCLDALDRASNAFMLPGIYLKAAALLGRRTAEMHLALASDPHDSAFAPEPLTEADLATACAEVQRQGEEALAALHASSIRLPEVELLAQAARSLARLDGVLAGALGVAKIRCHGDYHLGQVLVKDDFVILDFEGEPTRSVAERRAKQSPLRDVAGMLRSLDYAAYAGLFACTKDRPADFERLEVWAECWQRWTCDAFLREYLATAAGAPFLPAASEQTERLLRLFMLGKAFYELVYELNNRPDWVRIPLRGLLGLLQTAGPPGPLARG